MPRRLTRDAYRVGWICPLEVESTVSHTRLLDVLRSKGFPGCLIRLIRSFLESRTTTLCFDNQVTVARETPASVPQGSPLSPDPFYPLHFEPLRRLPTSARYYYLRIRG
jgi:hypothetical protein